jgi:hypothetical protein
MKYINPKSPPKIISKILFEKVPLGLACDFRLYANDFLFQNLTMFAGGVLFFF